MSPQRRICRHITLLLHQFNYVRVSLTHTVSAYQAVPTSLCLPQPHRIVQALRRYVRAENKDRQHTISHYKHVLAVDPEKAAQMKSQVSCLITIVAEFNSPEMKLFYFLSIRQIKSFQFTVNERGRSTTSPVCTIN